MVREHTIGYKAMCAHKIDYKAMMRVHKIDYKAMMREHRMCMGNVRKACVLTVSTSAVPGADTHHPSSAVWLHSPATWKGAVSIRK